MISDNAISPLLLDYWPDDSGATIRIDVNSREKLSELAELFRHRARSEAVEVRISSLDPAFAGDPFEIILRQVVSPEAEPSLADQVLCAMCGRASYTHQRLRLLPERDGGRMVFEWTNPPDRWDTCAGLIGAMLSHPDQPGHQYLTELDRDDALVVVGYLELGPTLSSSA